MNGNGLDAFKKRGNSKFVKFGQPGDTVAGVITEILVENERPVEFDQPLFIIE